MSDLPTPCPVHGPVAFAAEKELEHIHRHVEIIEQLLQEVLDELRGRRPWWHVW